VVTSYGFVRLVEMESIRARLDRAIPFGLERRDDSYPVAMAAVATGQDLVVATSAGRLVRVRPSAAPIQGVQALWRAQGERIVACLAVGDADRILLMTPDGAARSICAEAVPPPAAPNKRAKPLSTRLAVRAAAVQPTASPLWAVTSTSLRRLDLDQPESAAPPPRKPQRLLSLDAGEQITALVSPTPSILARA
jgi:hypothetical protein